jgi:hypothetical protein
MAIKNVKEQLCLSLYTVTRLLLIPVNNGSQPLRFKSVLTKCQVSCLHL